MDAVIAIETDLNVIVKEVLILKAVSKWFSCHEYGLTCSFSAVTYLKLWNMEFITLLLVT